MTERSRLTVEFVVRDPRLVRRSVSGATPTLKEESSNEVIVRHVPDKREKERASQQSRCKIYFIRIDSQYH